MSDFGYPVMLTTVAVAETNCYAAVSDGINTACAQADALPCLLDAANLTDSGGGGRAPENLATG